MYYCCSRACFQERSSESLLWVWCRSFRRAFAAGDELAKDTVDQLLKVLNAGASLSFAAPLGVAVFVLLRVCLLYGELPAVCRHLDTSAVHPVVVK